VGEYVHRMGNLAGRERRGEEIGVFGRDVRVLRRVPDEERRRVGCDQRIQRGRPTQLRAGVLAEKDHPGGAVGLGLHRRDGVAQHSEIHHLIGCGTRHEGGQPGQVASSREPHKPDALCASRPPTADLGAQRVKRHRISDIERVAEHARLHAYLGEPPGHRLGFVRSVHGVPATGQDDHVGTDRWRVCRHDRSQLRSSAAPHPWRRGCPQPRFMRTWVMPAMRM
jgi:GAF domain-containing protein